MSAVEVSRVERERFFSVWKMGCTHNVDELREEKGVIVCIVCEKPLIKRVVKP